MFHENNKRINDPTSNVEQRRAGRYKAQNGEADTGPKRIKATKSTL